MPAVSRARTRRVARGAKRKPPLTVEAHVGHQAHRGADAVAGRRGCLRGGDGFDMDKNESGRSCGCSSRRSKAAAKPRRLTAGDKDSDPKWSPGRQVDRLHREAQGRRRGAGLSDRARRRRGAASDRALDRLRRVKWFPDGRRIAFVSLGVAGPRADAAQARRMKERKETKVKAHVTERAEFRYWDHWLTDGREPHVFVRDVGTGRARDLLAGTGCRCSRGRRRTSTTTSAPTDTNWPSPRTLRRSLA